MSSFNPKIRHDLKFENEQTQVAAKRMLKTVHKAIPDSYAVRRDLMPSDSADSVHSKTNR